jgi:hypothetical protein
MSNQDYMKIGRYRSWIEDGKLKLYGHEVGAASGVFCSLDAAEAMGLLELLAKHREDINHALYVNEREHALHSHPASR